MTNPNNVQDGDKVLVIAGDPDISRVRANWYVRKINPESGSCEVCTITPNSVHPVYFTYNVNAIGAIDSHAHDVVLAP